MTKAPTTRVVITGIGAVTPLGIGSAAFWDALSRGTSGIGPSTMVPNRRAAEVKSCDWAALIGRRDTWNGSRCVSFALAAAKLALADARIDYNSEDRSGIGVALGATFSGLNLMARFDHQALREGPRTCDPTVFPDTGFSAAACRISIVFGATAFNTTLSNGGTSGLDAIQYGASMIRTGLAHTVLAGGLEETCAESFTFLRGVLAAPANGSQAFAAPFAAGRNGFVPGEGCAILVLEDYERALARGASVLGEVRGYGAAFHPGAPDDSAGLSRALCRSMRQALADASFEASAIGLVAASANSSPAGDLAEARAIHCVFGDSARPRVTAVKSMFGESLSAAGTLQAAAGLLSMRHGVIPPSIPCGPTDPACHLAGLVREPLQDNPRCTIVNTIGPAGNAASLVVSAPGF